MRILISSLKYGRAGAPRRRHAKAWAGASTGALVGALLVASPAAAAISARGPASAATYPSSSTTALSVAAPDGAQPGDLLVASIGFGDSSAKSQPTLAVPAGWTLATRMNKDSKGSLAVYTHPFSAGETTYTWTTNTVVGGAAFVTAYAGVDPARPVDASAGKTIGKGTSFAAPSVNTTVAGDGLVASYYGYRPDIGVTTWTSPSGMTELGEASNSSGTRSGSVHTSIQPKTGSTGEKKAIASATQEYAITVLTALRPAATATAPTITGVQAGAITTSSATMTWTTDQASDSQIEYGPTTSYGASTPLNSAAVTSHSQSITGLAPNAVYHYRVKSRNSAGQLAVSPDNTFQTSVAGAVPLIVDTDLWSDADDAGALATAFGLQLTNEAQVVAIGINTRTSRPAVATDSWKCAAAITNFYRSPAVPIGTSMPNNGTAVNDPDWVGRCSTLAPASTPAPASAVSVFRRALAAQPDGSVVVASAGYMGNLSALLESPADAISPLTGRELVARKVKSLVAMAGGYPQRSGENNLIGDPASAQNVSAKWPTKVIWSGYEVGDQVHTGDTISGVHPANSPVRVAYEAFVGSDHWIYSYDLTAVYHAIRPSDSLLTEVGPGTNTIDSTGGNVFTRGSGNQYYLTLSNATALNSSIESLLDTLPSDPPPPDTTPPAISGTGAGSVTSDGAAISWTTDERATTQVEYGTTTAYGSATTLDSSLATSHSQSLSGLAPSTLYHYRVKSTDAAGNLAVSGDLAFTTAAVGGPAPGVNDNFDSNVIDSSRWLAAPSGSTVTAANQQLEITHAAGPWTKGSLTARNGLDATGKSVQVQVKRAANNGLGGSTYGETSIFLSADSTHFAEFFVAGGSLTAWVNTGGSAVNLTTNWPAYNSTNMQWLRFREAGGRLYWEYASGDTSPGPWQTLTSTGTPFALGAVKLQMAAGANVNTTDTAKFDNVATY